MVGISLTSAKAAAEQAEQRQLGLLLEQVSEDISRTQVLFDLCEVERLTESLIYQLKSLELYRDYLIIQARKPHTAQPASREVELMG